MAIQALFYSIIIPFKNLGGYDYLRNMHPDRFGPNIWYDRFILRDGGAMSYMDIEAFLSMNESRGLEITEVKNGQEK
jgi:hypothetical protein